MWGRRRINELLGLGGGGRRRCFAFVVDGKYLANRLGPWVIESAKALAEMIHPSLLGHFGHHGTELLSTVEEAMALGEIAGEDRADWANVDVTTQNKKEVEEQGPEAG